MTLTLQNMKKRIFSIRFLIAVLLCVATGVYDIVENASGSPELMHSGSLNVFLHMVMFGRCLFSYTAPLIAAIASGALMYGELEQRYAMQPILRKGYVRYYISHIISAMLCGMLALILGFIILGIASIIISPGASYRIVSVHPITPFAVVYERSMLLYAVFVTLNAALFCGVYSVFACGVFTATNNYYAGYIIPAAFYSISTMSYGLLFGKLPVLPFSTFVMYIVTPISILKDTLIVFGLGTALSLFGYLRWKKVASY